MYCIVFSGRLLDGYDPQVVRKAVASRLNLDANQVERLFCGQRMVLKKGVTEESGRLYLDVLRRLGLDAGMARIPRSADTVQALATFKVVFWGRVQQGFDRDAVMRAAAARLKASPSQVERMFSGSKAVLKRGVSSEMGTKFVIELARIGMLIDLEVETVAKSPAKAAPVPAQIVVPAAAPVAAPARKPAGFRRQGDEDFAGLLQTQFELPGQTDYINEVPLEDQDRPVVASRTAASSYASALRQEAAPQVAKRAAAPQPVRTSMPAPAPASMAPSPEYIRCSQCGHRQTTSTHCRVCGSEIERPHHHPIPMDASAYASPTTILGNMPASMMRSGVATLPGSGEDLKAMMLMQPERNPSRAQSFLHKRAPTLLGVSAAVTILLWLIF